MFKKYIILSLFCLSTFLMTSNVFSQDIPDLHNRSKLNINDLDIDRNISVPHLHNPIGSPSSPNSNTYTTTSNQFFTDINSCNLKYYELNKKYEQLRQLSQLLEQKIALLENNTEE